MSGSECDEWPLVDDLKVANGILSAVLSIAFCANSAGILAAARLWAPLPTVSQAVQRLLDDQDDESDRESVISGSNGIELAELPVVGEQVDMDAIAAHSHGD